MDAIFKNDFFIFQIPNFNVKYKMLSCVLLSYDLAFGLDNRGFSPLTNHPP